MTDTPEETARKRQLLKELIQLEQEAGLYDEIVSPEEAVAITKQVRKELYEERERERNRIVSRLKEYVEDLRLCSKKDSCADIADAIQGQIEEITGEQMDNEEFIDGMAEVHEVVYTTLDRLQQSINDMMGVYMDMPDDITRQNPEVKELSAMHAVLNQFREMFIDNYDEAMRNYYSSKSWREDAEELKGEWPEV